MISMAFDRDPRWTWSKPTFHRKTISKSGQCTKWGMRYEHIKCERVLHDDNTCIVPNSKCFGGELQSMVLTNSKQTPTPSVAG